MLRPIILVLLLPLGFALLDSQAPGQEPRPAAGRKSGIGGIGGFGRGYFTVKP